jgi:homoserine dehydrogenase
MTTPLRVAVLGAGTVGREVVRALLDRAVELTPAGGEPLSLVGVAVRDLARAEAAGIPTALLTDAPAHLVASDETDVVVELMGGDEPARTLIAAALSAGKSVVTANKHVLAHHGAELEAIARRSRAALRFEASVGGGIPILTPLVDGIASASRVDTVRGIVNGTTNYILSAMGDDARSYADVLRDAQAAGYAEADPTADVEGFDAVNKLVVLARLAFGGWLDPGAIANRNGGEAPGITGVTAEDLAAAAEAGLAIKLVARATRVPDHATRMPDHARPASDHAAVRAAVSCVAVSQWSELAWVGGVTNAIEVEAAPLGRVWFGGPGAGGPATASAVLADLVAVARGQGSTWGGLASATPIALVAEEPGETFDAPSDARYPILPG